MSKRFSTYSWCFNYVVCSQASSFLDQAWDVSVSRGDAYMTSNTTTYGENLYHQTSRYVGTIAGYTLVDHSDVVGASRVGIALSSFSI